MITEISNAVGESGRGFGRVTASEVFSADSLSPTAVPLWLRMQRTLAAGAQQPEGMRRLAIIMLTADDADGQARITALREGLEKLGWTAHNGTWQCAPRTNSAVHTH